MSIALFVAHAVNKTAGQGGWQTFHFGNGLSIKSPVKFEALDTPTHRKGEGESWLGTYQGISLVIIVGPVKIANYKDPEEVAREQQKLFDYVTSHNPSTVTEQKFLSLKGWPGMRFRFTKDGAKVQFCSYYLGSTSVLLSATYPPKVDASKVCSQFFSSFSVRAGMPGRNRSYQMGHEIRLSKDGVSYSLPHSPTAPFKDSSGGVRYGAQVLSEIFTGYARTVKVGNQAEQLKLRNATVEENAKLVQAVSFHSNESMLGKDRATWTNYELKSGMRARSVAVMRGSNLAFLLALYPSGLTPGPELVEFLTSVRFSSKVK